MAIPDHFPFVRLDAFVIMPDHVHGIVVIDAPQSMVRTHGCFVVETQDFASLPPPPTAHLPPPPTASQHPPHTRTCNRFGPQSRNLASIIRGFKIGVTLYARQHGIDFAWQARYHDRIIRNEAERDRIRAYIADNPVRWMLAS